MTDTLPLLLPDVPGKVHGIVSLDPPTGRTCSVEGCGEKHYAHGLCRRHRRSGGGAAAECSISGCVKPAEARGWCNKHWLRWRRNGDPNVAKRDWTTGIWSASVSYSGAHMRVRAERGPASKFSCTKCSKRAQEWAYDHADGAALLETRGVTALSYSADPAHYIPMCKSCHKRFDLEVRS